MIKSAVWAVTGATRGLGLEYCKQVPQLETFALFNDTCSQCAASADPGLTWNESYRWRAARRESG